MSGVSREDGMHEKWCASMPRPNDAYRGIGPFPCDCKPGAEAAREDSGTTAFKMPPLAIDDSLPEGCIEIRTPKGKTLLRIENVGTGEDSGTAAECLVLMYLTHMLMWAIVCLAVTGLLVGIYAKKWMVVEAQSASRNLPLIYRDDSLSFGRGWQQFQDISGVILRVGKGRTIGDTERQVWHEGLRLGRFFGEQLLRDINHRLTDIILTQADCNASWGGIARKPSLGNFLILNSSRLPSHLLAKLFPFHDRTWSVQKLSEKARLPESPYGWGMASVIDIEGNGYMRSIFIEHERAIESYISKGNPWPLGQFQLLFTRFSLRLNLFPHVVGNAGIPSSGKNGEEGNSSSCPCSVTGRALYVVLSAIAYLAITFRLIVRGKEFFKTFLFNLLLMYGALVNFIFSSIVLVQCFTNLT